MRALDRRFVLGWLLPAVASVALMSGCSATDLVAEDEPLCKEPAANADPAWPQTTLEDWVSYSDQLAIVRVKGETPLSPLEETDMNGGMVGRSVDLELEQTVWRRNDDAPLAPRTFSMIVDPWMVDGHDAKRWNIGGGAWFEVGKRYVVPLARVQWEGEDPAWTVGGEGTPFPLEGSTIVCGTIHPREQTSEDVTGWTVSELAARFADTEPDPRTLEFAELDPLARWLAVSGD